MVMHSIKKLAVVQHLILQVQRTCYETAKELEEKQCWYDIKPDLWKRSLHGRRWARMLFKAHKLIGVIEHFEIPNRKLYSKGLRVSKSATEFKSVMLCDKKPNKCQVFDAFTYQEIVGIIQLLMDDGNHR